MRDTARRETAIMRWQARLVIIMAILSAATGMAEESRDDQPLWRRRRGSAASEDSEARRIEMRAHRMIDNASELIAARQEERGQKLLQQIPRMFPESQARFAAHLALGRFLVTKRRYEEAVTEFKKAEESEEDEERAEAMYRQGICHYQANDFDRAFLVLRRVTNEYPWSVFANEAYYYIGQCHFKLRRWSKAVEALRMVGTSVPPESDKEQLAEIGQRLLIKVHDRDLVVLEKTGEVAHVEITTDSGDTERLSLEMLNSNGEDYIASLKTILGPAVPGDGMLQTRGGDRVRVTYVDNHTRAGKQNQRVLATVRMASNASIGFMDGAFREYTEGVFANQPAFVRIKDFDRDVSDKADQITISVRAQYVPESTADVEARGVDLNDSPEPIVRSRTEIILTETGPNTGIFTGRLEPVADENETDAPADRNSLLVQSGDVAILEYTDDSHLEGNFPRDLEYRASVLLGRIPGVTSTKYDVNDPNLKAKKLLIEAKIFLKWAGIFKDVGLTNKADEKAQEGLDRVDTVRRISTQGSLDRSLVEDAYNVEWDLLLVQGRLRDAIRVCFELTKLFPDTDLADKAFLQIANAKIEAKLPTEALPVLYSILKLPNSRVKDEAQFRVAEAQEAIAVEQAKKATERSGRQEVQRPNLSVAMQSYMKCAESYPASPYAGESLKRIVKYYITYQDYPRAIETLERIFLDYQDVDWLDDMLLYWGIAAYRMKDYAQATAKFRQVLEEYPGGTAAGKARTYLQTVNRKAEQ